MSRIVGRPHGYWGERVTLKPQTPDQEATLAGWLIHAPGQSPAWSDYLLMLVHLRDLPGVPPATRKFPEAEYQMTLFALDPEGKPRADDAETWWPLTPFNAEVQFAGPTSDSQAMLGSRHYLREKSR